MNSEQSIAADGARCRNCGAMLTGAYCAACGQRAQVHRSLTAFSGDLVASLFNFESRFWRTLPMLAWCPGDLTRRYVEGERARFVSPVALYLFSVFLMFAALSLSGAETVRIDGNINDAIRLEQTEIRQLEAERATAARAGQPTATLDRRIEAGREQLADLQRLTGSGIPQGMEGSPKWLQDGVRRIAANPQGTVTRVQEAASRYSWALIPLSVPFLWLLFPFSRRHRMYDHTVFVTYSLSFMMLLILLASLLVMIGASAAAPWLLLLPPWHMYRQLKGAYRLGRFGALWRTVALLICAMLTISLFVTILVGLEFVG